MSLEASGLRAASPASGRASPVNRLPLPALEDGMYVSNISNNPLPPKKVPHIPLINPLLHCNQESVPKRTAVMNAKSRGRLVPSTQRSRNGPIISLSWEGF
jgi:hypothetical protein